MGIRDFFLTDKVAFIAGARRGLGRAMALVFADAGADVVVTDVVGNDELRDVAEEVRGLGRRALALQLDVTRKDDIETAVQRVTSEFGGIDILVNSATMWSNAHLIDLEERDWDAMVDVALKGCFLTSQAVAKRMIERKRGGSIINISSRSYLRPREGNGAYPAAKAGVITLTGQLAVELGPFNIRVNAIAPSVIETESTARLTQDAETRSMIEAEIPLGRLGKAEEIANVALFLACDAASYVSGVAVLVDGGSIWAGARSRALKLRGVVASK